MTPTIKYYSGKNRIDIHTGETEDVIIRKLTNDYGTHMSFLPFDKKVFHQLPCSSDDVGGKESLASYGFSCIEPLPKLILREIL